jgi:hypothetical protein
MPPGVGVSGRESDGGDRFFCGGGSSGKVRGRPPAQARLRAGQRLRAPRRLHEPVIEAAPAGERRYLDEQVLSD